MDNELNQNLLTRLEGISSAASNCELNFRKLETVISDIREVSGFLGISDDQAVFFSCLTDIGFQKPVTLESLAKHLNCSVLKLIACMTEIESLISVNIHLPYVALIGKSLAEAISKWFGESEKVVKKIFDDYSALLGNCHNEPILFINEADGLFSKRIDLNSGRGNSTEQSVNTIQNILLQALENFEGILIATTNLTDNLDKAFERRFTFRLRFPKPDSLVRKSIWRSKLPGLSESEAMKLAEMFEMTGGEIDIQVRQVILKKVLGKKVRLFDALMDCCSNDQGFSSKRKIGF